MGFYGDLLIHVWNARFYRYLPQFCFRAYVCHTGRAPVGILGEGTATRGTYEPLCCGAIRDFSGHYWVQDYAPCQAREGIMDIGVGRKEVSLAERLWSRQDFLFPQIKGNHILQPRCQLRRQRTSCVWLECHRVREQGWQGAEDDSDSRNPGPIPQSLSVELAAGISLEPSSPGKPMAQRAGQGRDRQAGLVSITMAAQRPVQQAKEKTGGRLPWLPGPLCHSRHGGEIRGFWVLEKWGSKMMEWKPNSLGMALHFLWRGAAALPAHLVLSPLFAAEQLSQAPVQGRDKTYSQAPAEFWYLGRLLNFRQAQENSRVTDCAAVPLQKGRSTDAKSQTIVKCEFLYLLCNSRDHPRGNMHHHFCNYKLTSNWFRRFLPCR